MIELFLSHIVYILIVYVAGVLSGWQTIWIYQRILNRRDSNKLNQKEA